MILGNFEGLNSVLVKGFKIIDKGDLNASKKNTLWDS